MRDHSEDVLPRRRLLSPQAWAVWLLCLLWGIAAAPRMHEPAAVSRDEVLLTHDAAYLERLERGLHRGSREDRPHRLEAVEVVDHQRGVGEGDVGPVLQGVQGHVGHLVVDLLVVGAPGRVDQREPLRPALGQQVARCCDQRLAQIAVVIAAAGRRLGLRGAAGGCEFL